MPDWVVYLLKFNISITLLYLFYWLILRKLTFYHWNRLYLVGCTFLCFLIPNVDIGPFLDDTTIGKNGIIESIQVFSANPGNPVYSVPTGATQLKPWELCAYLLASGIVIMIIRLLIQYSSLIKIKRRAKIIAEAPIKLFRVEESIVPFSFGSGIFINPDIHHPDEIQTIISHEFIHVKQNHSIDILYAELLCIFTWYNPIAWLLKHAIRQNLEFIADNQVLEKGTDRKTYQYLLLKVMGVTPAGMTNSFNFTSLKKRIFMMNKIRTAKAHLTRFALILPLILILLLAFRQQSNNIPQNSSIPDLDTLPEKKPKTAVVAGASNIPKGAIAAPIPGGDARSISVDKSNKATVKLKNGNIKTYDLNNPGEKKTFENKYRQPVQNATNSTITQVAVSANVSAVENIPNTANVSVTSRVSSTVTTTVTEPVIATTVSDDLTAFFPATVSISGIEDLASTVGTTDKFSVSGVMLLEISKNTSREKLEQMIVDLRKKGYDFRINDMKFENGVLISIDGSLAKGSATSHFLASDFSALIVTETKNKSGKLSFQFYVEKGKLNVN